jgi:ribosomal protein L21E
MLVTYKSGDKVHIHMDVLGKAGVDVDLYAGFVEDEYFAGIVLSLHAGRTWNVEMEFGETVRIASKNFFKEAGEK